MNKIILIGNLTKDPELKTTTSNINYAHFTLAVAQSFKNNNGEARTDFINCVAWRNQAENLCKYQSKGSKVAVSGRLSVRSYVNNDNQTVYITEVIAEEIEYLASKNSNANAETKSNDNLDQFTSTTIIREDDLPF